MRSIWHIGCFILLTTPFMMAQRVVKKDTSGLGRYFKLQGFSVNGAMGSGLGDLTPAGANKLMNKPETAFLTQSSLKKNDTKMQYLPTYGAMDISVSFFRPKHIENDKFRYLKLGLSYEGGFYKDCSLKDSVLTLTGKTYRYENYYYVIRAFGLYAGQEFFTRPSRRLSGSLGYSAGLIRTISTGMYHEYSEWVNAGSVNDTTIIIADTYQSAKNFTGIRLNGYAAFWIRVGKERYYFSRSYLGGGIRINADVNFSGKYSFGGAVRLFFVEAKFFFF